VEDGRIQHIPSTQDLLVAQGIDPGRLRTTASKIAASMQVMEENWEPSDSPTSSASGPVTSFRLDREDSLESNS
jgi:hypothetical protein